MSQVQQAIGCYLIILYWEVELKRALAERGGACLELHRATWEPLGKGGADFLFQSIVVQSKHLTSFFYLNVSVSGVEWSYICSGCKGLWWPWSSMGLCNYGLCWTPGTQGWLSAPVTAIWLVTERSSLVEKASEWWGWESHLHSRQQERLSLLSL